ncbi:ABC transporter substrate-binding protein [Microlunatus sp. GCM10028923]|uniref:ABC transporter substrate-binding protein n=1 Tax=Microlunatus sp. GCM10028923 TaxID=3273400 RepID=UPI00361529B6
MSEFPLSRRTLLGIGVSAGAAATLASTGCTGGSATGMAARTELRIGVQSLPSTLDANGSVSNSGIQAYHNIYDTLIARDTKADKPAFKPGLAKTWKQVEELTWEFELRDDVKFHDGSPFTAADVVYSMNRVITKEDPSYATAYAYLLSNVTEFKAVDDVTVRATTKHPEPLMEHLLSDPNAGISAKAYTTEAGLDAASNKPVATGPYKVTEYTPDVSLILEAVPGHWSGEPPYTKITYLSIPEIASRITALKNDEVDFITNIPPDQETLLTGDQRVKVVGGVLELYHIYRLNMSNPALAKPELRAALDYAIDREAIVSSIWDGKAEAATSYQFTSYPDTLKFPDRQDIAFDQAKAKQLVASSGYAGEVIEIYNTTNYYTYADLVAQAVVDMWADVGVTAKLVQVDDIPDEDPGLEIRTWSNPLYYPDPMGMIERHWAPAGEAANVKHFVATEAYTDAFNRMRYGQDEAERKEALEELFDFYRAQTPFVYLFKPYESLGMRSNIDYTQSPNLRPYCLSFRAGDIAERST